MALEYKEEGKGRDNLERIWTEKSSPLDAKCRKANAELLRDDRGISHICTVQSDNNKTPWQRVRWNMTFSATSTEAIGVSTCPIRKTACAWIWVCYNGASALSTQRLMCSGSRSDMDGVGGMSVQGDTISLAVKDTFLKSNKRERVEKENAYSQNICGFLLSNISLM